MSRYYEIHWRVEECDIAKKKNEKKIKLNIKCTCKNYTVDKRNKL